MTITDGKITACTEAELYEYWLKRYDDIISFPDYMEHMKDLGVTITEDES